MSVPDTLRVIEVVAFCSAMYLLRVQQMKRSDYQHVAIDIAFALLVFWGYIEVIQTATGIGFAHSPLQPWTEQAASALQIRALIAKHEGIAILAYILWTTYFNYWSHRLFHKFQALWELHKVHHSATRMTGMSQFRVHPLEDIIGSYVAPILITLVLPETGPRFALYFGFISIVHNVAVHSEWKASWGLVGLVFTSPLAHQIHHSTNPKHFNSNYGVPLCIWDRLHGTYVDPLKSEAPEKFGVEDVAPTNVRGLILTPAERFVKRIWPSGRSSLSRGDAGL